MRLVSRVVPRLRRMVSLKTWVWLLPNLVLGLFVVALFAVLVVLARHETETQKQALARDIQWAEKTIHTHLLENQEFLQALARDMANRTYEQAAFQDRTARYIQSHPDLRRIVWIDADQVVRWVAPVEDKVWHAGERLCVPEEAFAFQRAQRTGVPAYAMPDVPPDESAVIELHVPVMRGRASKGAVVAIYAADQVLRYLDASWFWDKYRVVMETEDRVISANSRAGIPTDLNETVHLDPPGQGLRLRVSSFAAESTVRRDVLLLLIGGLVLVMAWSFSRARVHTRGRLAAERERDRLFNLSLDLLCVTRLDGTIVRANPAFERVLGTPPAAVQGRALLDLVHPDDLVVTMGQVAKLARGEPSGFENRCRRSNGQYRWLAWSANPDIEDKRLYCVAHDVTDRKRTEDAIRTESAFRKAMEESVFTGLRAVDIEGRITFVNPAFCEMVGWTAEELIGTMAPFPYWPEEELENLERTQRAWMGGHTPRGGFEVRIRRKSGERFFARMYVSPLVAADGHQTGWMASLVDITEQKQARLELEASRQRFVAVLEGLDSAIHVVDVATGESLFANEAFKNVCGTQMLPCGRPDLRHLSTEELPLELSDGEARNQKDGRWYQLRERAIRWVDGRVVLLQTATDITDRKRAEELTLQQQERLLQTSRLITMGEMASSVAHELNQPLAAIANYCSGCVSRIRSGSFSVEDLLAVMQKASAQAERAGKIIRHIRDFVRKREPNRTPVAVADILDEALGIAEIEARKAGVEITVRLPDDLPRVFADKIMIEQVVLNLLKNGIESMDKTPHGSRQLTVSASADDGRAVELSVIDRGPGITSDQLEKLFMPFYTTKNEGLGMGLRICRSIVEYHDGRLWAESNNGGGSRFAFTLPIQR